VSPRAAVRLAWGLWGLAVALRAAALVLDPAQVQPASASLWLRGR
jgi:hypothetical protein